MQLQQVHLAAPVPPPSAPAPAVFPGLAGIRWETWEGATWDLLSPSAGSFLLPGVRGLTMPDAVEHTDESPAVAGSFYLGEHVTEREVFWPLYLYSNAGSREWVERDRAFWRGLRRGKFGWWVVTHPDGTERRLRCKFRSDGGHAYTVDPTRTGWAAYGITLVAHEPYWQGATVVRAWKAGEPVEFYQADGLHIAPGSRLDSARMPNDGDVEGWPVWRAHGPSTSVSVGVNGQSVEVPFPLAQGESVTIDTHPTRQTAIDNYGTDRTRELGATDFAPIEPGASVALDLDLVGTGYVEASLTPLYERAW